MADVFQSLGHFEPAPDSNDTLSTLSHVFPWSGVHVPYAARVGAMSPKGLVLSTKRSFETKNTDNSFNIVFLIASSHCQMLPEGEGDGTQGTHSKRARGNNQKDTTETQSVRDIGKPLPAEINVTPSKSF